MTEPAETDTIQNRTTLVTLADVKKVGRRRVTTRVARTSDVTRFRPLVWALTASCAVLGLGVFILPGQRDSRHALTGPHAQAKLQCASCHAAAPSSAPTANTCVGCHAGQSSTRTSHNAALASGNLTCLDCHSIHDAQRITFDAQGRTFREHGSTRARLSLVQPQLASSSVAVVSADACTKCHSLRPEDSAAACFVGVEGNDLAAQPSTCFSEHRASVGSAGTDRFVAWDAARVALQLPVISEEEHNSGQLWLGPWIMLSLLCGGFVWWQRSRQLRSPVVPLAAGNHDAAVAQALRPATVKKLPQVNARTCIGCNACVDVCPYDVLELRNYVAVVARPDACCGLTLCQQRCPNGSLVIREGEPIEDRPNIDERLESIDTRGVFLAGDITGLPLIRNAINQGAFAMRNVAASLAEQPALASGLDVVIVGAGPAGVSASLEAQRLGLRHVVLEQGSVGESIRTFPRGKLVFDQPLGMPVVGDLWLRESTKEELLSKWLRIVESQRLPVVEGSRVTALAAIEQGRAFRLDVIDVHGRREQLHTRRVLLSFGTRGTPRKLEVAIPEAMQNHVHYHMADARTFAGKRVLVVGLGDVAMETAAALALQPNTQVTISYRGQDFGRGAARNVAQIKRLASQGRIELRFDTQVQEVADRRVVLRSSEALWDVPCDAVFVMVGSIAPWNFLESLGVHRVAKRKLPSS